MRAAGWLWVALALALGLAADAAAADPAPLAVRPGDLVAASPDPAALVLRASALALPSAWVNPGGVPPALEARRSGGGPRRPLSGVLTAERARILLRSLTVPGWGQASLGHRRSGLAFAVAEAGIWASYTSFRIQEGLRRNSSEETAQLYAGIDLDGRDEEFRRIVGAFPSSDLYNILVVRREAANRYYPTSDLAGYNAYVAEHELRGDNAWAWVSPEAFERYRDQRQSAQRAAQRANYALAVAVANRLLSAIHAARLVHRGAPPSQGAAQFQLLCVPSASDPTALQVGVSARF